MNTIEGLELALASASNEIDELNLHLRELAEENAQLYEKVEFQKAAWAQEHEELQQARYHLMVRETVEGETIATLRQQLVECQTELEAVRKDAARYRWLRDETMERPDFYSGEPRWEVSFAQGGVGSVFRGEKIDAAIDNAMRGEGE